MLSNCLSRLKKAQRSLSKQPSLSKTENALSVLKQASWGITLLLIGLAGLVATLVLGRGFRNNAEVYARDAPFLQGLGSRRVIYGVASFTMTALAFAIGSLFSVLYKLWVQWQLEKGITPFEVMWPAQAAGWLTLFLFWCTKGLARWCPCAKGISMAGHPPRSSTVWLLMASVLSSVVLLGCNFVPFLLAPQEVTVPVHLNDTMTPRSISISVPSVCNQFDGYTSEDNTTVDWQRLKDMAADGDNMWMRNAFDTSTLDVFDAGKKHGGLRARVGRALGWPAKHAPEPEGLRERLRTALGGDEFVTKDVFELSDAWSNSVLFADGKKLNACTTKALKGEKLNSANEWSVQEDRNIRVGVVSGWWTEEDFPVNVTGREIASGKRVFDDEPGCLGCWGQRFSNSSVESGKILLRLIEGAPGNASELRVWLRTGGSKESFALRASLLEVTGDLSVEGRDNMVLGSLRVRNYTVESGRFARVFACNILQVLMYDKLSPQLGSKCLNQSGKWFGDTVPDDRSVGRMIKNAARLAPGGNVRVKGASLQLPGPVAAILGFTIAMQLTDGKFDKADEGLGYGLRSQTLTVILPKMQAILYTCIVLLEVGAAAALLAASLCIARVTRYNSVNVDPYLFFSRLSKEEKERLELEIEVMGKDRTAWRKDSMMTLTEMDGHVQLTRQNSSRNVPPP